MIKKHLLSSVVLLTLIGQVNATEQATSNKSAAAWGGEAEIGILMTRGNTNTDTQNIKLGVHYNADSWEHKLQLESLRTEDSGVVSADRFVANYRSTYNFSTLDYGFGALRHENDRFAGFDKRDTEVLGYGRKLYNEKSLIWAVEAGVGARQTARTDNTDTNEGIFRLATNIVWKITETSLLSEDLSIESGSTNTATESTTSLKVKINSSLAMKLGFKIQDNSDVPIGIKHTDTQTSLTLVYDI